VSLASRVTALAQTIGADIKDLKNKVAMGAAGLVLGSGPATGTNSSGTFGPAIPLGVVSKMLPAGFFTLNTADNSISVLEAGWYSISALVATGANLPANTPTGASIFLNGGDTGVVIVETSYYGRLPLSLQVYLTPTDKIDLRGWCATVAITTWTMMAFAMTRSGGPQGPKGDPGARGSIPVYEQATQPVTSEIGAIWIKG
jgi:hypothetical protein